MQSDIYLKFQMIYLLKILLIKWKTIYLDLLNRGS